MKELRTAIEIQASAERAWQWVIDFASFPNEPVISAKRAGTSAWGTARSHTSPFPGQAPTTFDDPAPESRAEPGVAMGWAIS